MQGPPLLTPAGGADGLELRVGEAAPPIGITLFSRGGPSIGLSITLEGSALERGLLDLTALRLLSHAPDTENQFVGTTISAPLERSTADGRPCYRVLLADVPIAAGIADAMALYTGEARVNPQLAANALRAGQLSIALDGGASAAGAGELVLRVAPLANPTAGEAIWRLQLTVQLPGRAPLRAHDAPGLLSQARALASPARLVALVALGADRARSALAAEAAIALWSAVLATEEADRYHVTLQRETRLRPQQRQLLLQEVPDGAGWEELRAILQSGETLGGHLPHGPADETDDLFSPGAGFLFDATSLFFRLGGDTLSPQLILYLDHRPEQKARSIRAEIELRAIMDDLMRDGDGLQALLAHWAWGGLLSAQSTPYELACGVHGQCTTGLRWCSRYLRGVADTLWLGPALRTHLGDLDSLHAVAQVDAVDGDVWRLRRRPEAPLDELERVLAPLLPGHAEWVTGTHGLYHRS